METSAPRRQHTRTDLGFRFPICRLSFVFVPWWLAATFLWVFAVEGQEPGAQLKISVDATTITVGDVLTVKLEVKHPESQKLAFPAFGPALGEWSVLGSSRLPVKTLQGGIAEEVLELQLSIYKTGDVVVPAFELELVKTNGEKGKLASEPVQIKVQSVLTGNADTLKDVKPQAEIAADYKPLFFFLAALGSAAYLLYRLVQYLKRRKETQPPLPQDLRSPEEIARQAIEQLIAKKLVERGLLKQFYLELSEIMKRFLGAKLGILSLERTTEEFTRDLRSTSVPAVQYRMIREFLEECDLVKFAKYRPANEEVQQILARSREMVESVSAPPVPMAEVAK